MPTYASRWRSPIAPRRITASRPSFSRRACPGFRAGKKENKLGMRASATGEVLFTDCRAPGIATARQSRAKASLIALRILDGGRISIAALAVGTAQGAYEAALKYSKHPQTIRPAHLRISGHPAQAGRHGHRDRRGPPAHLPRRMDEGPGRAGHQGIRHGQAVRLRDRRARRATKPCRSTAATASSRIIRSKSSIATSSSAPSAKAPARSSAW